MGERVVGKGQEITLYKNLTWVTGFMALTIGWLAWHPFGVPLCMGGKEMGVGADVERVKTQERGNDRSVRQTEPCANLPAGMTLTGHTVKGGCVGGGDGERWRLKRQEMAEERVRKRKS